jgi:hypothetical protein
MVIYCQIEIRLAIDRFGREAAESLKWRSGPIGIVTEISLNPLCRTARCRTARSALTHPCIVVIKVGTSGHKMSRFPERLPEILGTMNAVKQHEELRHA